MSDNREYIESFGYCVADRVTAMKKAPQRERIPNYNGAFAIYDPDDDSDGWLLVGDDAEALVTETAAMIRESL